MTEPTYGFNGTSSTDLTMTPVATASVNFADKIFNPNKTDYENTPIFFGQDAGLVDTINKRHPRLWQLYKTLKKLDWDELEFDFAACNVEFKTCPKDTYDMMLKTLAWQWEADSIASRSVLGILGPVLSSSEVVVGYARIVDNENLHALTYSEISGLSFDDPHEILDEIKKVDQAHERLTIVNEVMQKAYVTSHQYALGMIPKSQEAYEDIFMFLVALYALERVQFMASFAVTFAICQSGLFQSIGKAVQKIAQDEYEIHAPYGEEILKIELATERGKLAFKNLRPRILQMFNQIVGSEHEWVDYLFSEGRQLTGMSPEKLKSWVSFNARKVYFFFGLQKESLVELPEINPLKFMEKWIDISGTQSANQESHGNQYKVGVVSRLKGNKIYDFPFPGTKPIINSIIS